MRGATRMDTDILSTAFLPVRQDEGDRHPKRQAGYGKVEKHHL